MLFYGEPELRLRLTEMVGGTIEKYVRLEQGVERVEVNGEPGIWVEGRHVVYEPFGLPRLSGNVLLWEQQGLTLRLEGRVTKEQALDARALDALKSAPSEGGNQNGEVEPMVVLMTNAADTELILEAESERVTAWRACELLRGRLRAAHGRRAG